MTTLDNTALDNTAPEGKIAIDRVGEKRPITIAVVGDVHEQWDAAADEAALRLLGVDLVLIVGDFGNEKVEVVEAIAALTLPKAVICGNHDAWYNATEWGRRKCPYDRAQENRVQQQLDLLGETHVGYRCLNFPSLGVSVVGSRPFSWGGSEWKNKTFYREWYGVSSFEESTEKMMAAVQTATQPTIVFVGHSGPTGLGSAPEDPCGRDWNPPGGDFGDPDFAAAIAQTQEMKKTVAMVAFGHMHHHLRYDRSRLRKCIDVDTQGTVYLNAARVPRVLPAGTDQKRNFSLVTLQNGKVQDASLVWVHDESCVIEREDLFSSLALMSSR